MRSRRSCTDQPLDHRRGKRNVHPLFRKNSDPAKEALRRRTELEIPGFVLVVRQVRFSRLVLMGLGGKG